MLQLDEMNYESENDDSTDSYFGHPIRSLPTTIKCDTLEQMCKKVILNNCELYEKLETPFIHIPPPILADVQSFFEANGKLENPAFLSLFLGPNCTILHVKFSKETWTPEVVKQFFKNTVKHCSKTLRTLRLQVETNSFPPLYVPGQLSSLLGSLHGLTELHLSGVGLNDETLTVICSIGQQLRHLDISMNREITPLGVLRLFDDQIKSFGQCNKLTYLDLQNLNINEFVIARAISYLPDLVTLIHEMLIAGLIYYINNNQNVGNLKLNCLYVHTYCIKDYATLIKLMPNLKVFKIKKRVRFDLRETKIILSEEEHERRNNNNDNLFETKFGYAEIHSICKVKLYNYVSRARAARTIGLRGCSPPKNFEKQTHN